MAHTIVMVPEGHTVQVHPPGTVPQPGIPQQQAPMPGMVPDPAAQGAKAIMDAAVPREPKKAAKKEAGHESAKKGKA